MSLHLSRRVRLFALLVLGSSLAIGCSRSENAIHSEAANALEEPPQHLPITARWCLDPEASGDRCIQLEVPRGNRQITIGLQMRPPLPSLRGMWFPFEPPARVKFWMHRTPSPLDMIFVRDDVVIAVETDVPPCMRLPCPTYGPEVPIQGVVELAAGQAEALGIRVGTPVRIEDLPALDSPPAQAPSGTDRPGEKSDS